MTVTAAQIAKAQHFLTNVPALAAACDTTGLPFYLACTIMQKETGGDNIYGHDQGGAMSRPGRHEVTEANYREFRKLIDAGHTSNGVGCFQITWRGYFPNMEAHGLKPWIPADNILYGCQILAKTWNATHSVYQVGKAYNGNASYGTAAAALAVVWMIRVGTDDQMAPDPESDPPILELPPMDLAGNIKELAAENSALPHPIQLACAEILTACENAGHHIPAITWFNPASTPEHHVPGFPGQGGVANDFMVYGNTTMQDWLDNYVWSNRARLGVCWIISRRRIRSTSPGHSGNWTTYTGPNPHLDHTHVNFGHLAGQSGYGSVTKVNYVAPGPKPPPGPKPYTEGWTPPKPWTFYLDKQKIGVTQSTSVWLLQHALGKKPYDGNYVPTLRDAVQTWQKDVAKDDPKFADGILGPRDAALLFGPDVTVQASSA